MMSSGQVGRGRLAVIHVAKASLRLDDAAYRALLQRAAGVTSARDLNATGFDAVMAEFARLGFTSTAAAERVAERSRPKAHSTYAQRQCIAAKWEAWKGRRDDAGLRRWLERHFHVSSLQFVSRELAPKVLAALGNFHPRAPGTNAAARKRATKPPPRQSEESVPPSA